MTKTYLKYRTRITVMAGLIILSWAGLCVRLFQVQIVQGSKYQEVVSRQAQRKQDLPANRGNIFDREGRPLTRNIIHYTLSANPSKVVDKTGLAKAISERTGKPIDTYLKKLNSKSKGVDLEPKLQRETLGTLETTSFAGLNIKRKYRRYYPHNQIAAQVIGYTDIDDKGISGIEKDFNNYLTGKPGWVYKTKGWNGKIQLKSGLPFQSPTNGNNIQLTLDLEYQSVLEEELIRRQNETGAVSATGIIMNPETGEILAMASTPGFDNNKFNSTPSEFHRIRAITDQFEPGSTYKVVSAVTALENQTISLTDEFNCENGEWKYHSIPVTDHIPYAMLTLPQIIHHSSNIGIVKIMESIGSKSLYKTSRHFGFGTPTRISLNGETSGRLMPVNEWSAVSLGQISMGHEIGVSALQIATAYCAIANGGYLVRPRIVNQIVDNDDNIIYSESQNITRKIASESVMSVIRDMLRGVVVNGTGKNADIPGWGIAGKTGTAQKWKNGQYSDDQFISNFVGFFPYESPQLVTFIMLDEPRQPYHWGSEGAAVAYRRVMERIISMDDSIQPPTSVQKNFDFAQINPAEDIIIADVEPTGIPASTLPPALQTVAKYTNKVEIPELRGFSMRKAMTTLREIELKIKMSGSGKVVWQSPKPGTIVNKGSVCAIGLK